MPRLTHKASGAVVVVDDDTAALLGSEFETKTERATKPAAAPKK